MDEATSRETARGETVLGQNNYGIYDLELFVIENGKEIFHTTQDPCGQIESSVEGSV